MKLHLSRFTGQNAFSGYGNDYVLINGERYESSLVVMPDELRPWSPPSLDGSDLDALIALPIEILLLGTGPRLRFPPSGVTMTFRRHGIGLEVMDTPAACRTYNILLAEGRKVGAALVIGSALPV